VLDRGHWFGEALSDDEKTEVNCVLEKPFEREAELRTQTLTLM